MCECKQDMLFTWFKQTKRLGTIHTSSHARYASPATLRSTPASSLAVSTGAVDSCCPNDRSSSFVSRSVVFTSCREKPRWGESHHKNREERRPLQRAAAATPPVFGSAHLNRLQSTTDGSSCDLQLANQRRDDTGRCGCHVGAHRSMRANCERHGQRNGNTGTRMVTTNQP